MKTKKPKAVALTEVFQCRIETSLNPHACIRKLVWLDVEHRITKFPFQILMGLVLFNVGVITFTGGPPVTEVRQFVYGILGAIMFRISVRKLMEPLFPTGPEYLVAWRWKNLERDLRTADLWRRVVDTTTSEELEENIECYFEELRRDILMCTRSGHVKRLVVAEHRFLHARAAVEGLLGISVPNLERFSIEESIPVCALVM